MYHYYMTKKIAVYPGTFDPVTCGHLDVIERALDIFDEVIVAVLVNQGKTPLFATEKRLELLRACTAHLKGVRVDSFGGLLVDFMKKSGSKIALRGLRTATDLEYEFQLSTTNNLLDPSIDTVFLMPSPKFNFLTSSMVREAYALGGELEGCVPPCVHAALKERFTK